MASMLKFAIGIIETQEEIKRSCDNAEISYPEKFTAARKIQAWIRGILSRNHLCVLHKSARTIQRHWRGYSERARAERFLIETVHQMWQKHYDRMATKIQALWRGYWARKTRLNISKIKVWLQSVHTKNEETLDAMKKFRENEIEQARTIMEQESMLWILFILFKLHHLLRTESRPGVITKIDRTHFTLIEEMLKCFEYRLYVPKRKTDFKIDTKRSLLFHGTYYERCEREIREFEENLRAGKVSILRSQPYEEKVLKVKDFEVKLALPVVPKRRNKINNTPPLKHSNNSFRSLRGKKSCSKLDLKWLHDDSNELYNEIRKMDCHLNRFCINCPIHNTPMSNT